MVEESMGPASQPGFIPLSQANSSGFALKNGLFQRRKFAREKSHVSFVTSIDGNEGDPESKSLGETNNKHFQDDTLSERVRVRNSDKTKTTVRSDGGPRIFTEKLQWTAATKLNTQAEGYTPRKSHVKIVSHSLSWNKSSRTDSHGLNVEELRDIARERRLERKARVAKKLLKLAKKAKENKTTVVTDSGEAEIFQEKLKWERKAKLNSLENMNYIPGPEPFDIQDNAQLWRTLPRIHRLDRIPYSNIENSQKTPVTFTLRSLQERAALGLDLPQSGAPTGAQPTVYTNISYPKPPKNGEKTGGYSQKLPQILERLHLKHRNEENKINNNNNYNNKNKNVLNRTHYMKGAPRLGNSLDSLDKEMITRHRDRFNRLSVNFQSIEKVVLNEEGNSTGVSIVKSRLPVNHVQARVPVFSRRKYEESMPSDLKFVQKHTQWDRVPRVRTRYNLMSTVG